MPIWICPSSSRLLVTTCQSGMCHISPMVLLFPLQPFDAVSPSPLCSHTYLIISCILLISFRATILVLCKGLIQATHLLIAEVEMSSTAQCRRFRCVNSFPTPLKCRHADRDGMNDLVRQFSAVLTPQNQTPPNRIPGRGSASTGGCLEMHTIPSTELQNRCASLLGNNSPMLCIVDNAGDQVNSIV